MVKVFFSSYVFVLHLISLMIILKKYRKQNYYYDIFAIKLFITNWSCPV